MYVFNLNAFLYIVLTSIFLITMKTWLLKSNAIKVTFTYFHVRLLCDVGCCCEITLTTLYLVPWFNLLFFFCCFIRLYEDTALEDLIRNRSNVWLWHYLNVRRYNVITKHLNFTQTFFSFGLVTFSLMINSWQVFIFRRINVMLKQEIKQAFQSLLFMHKISISIATSFVIILKFWSRNKLLSLFYKREVW